MAKLTTGAKRPFHSLITNNKNPNNMNFQFQDKKVSVRFADSLPSGYGHKKIKVELECEGESESFIATTNFMPGYDAANDLDGQDRYDALYDLIDSQIEGEVLEWLTQTFSN
jgi:hypothetical protein